MLISFIILSYNSCKTIEKAVQSIINQSDYDFEIIVCDGGSKDNTEDLLKKYGSVKFISCPIASPAAQSEFAIKQSAGEYISFVDSDDYISPLYCKEVFPILKKVNPDIFTFNFFIESGGKVKKYREKRQLKSGFYCGDKYNNIINNVYKNIGSISRCSKIVKREIAEKVCDYYNSSIQSLMWEDTFYTYPLFLMASNVYVSDFYLYYYVMNSSSITHTIKYDLEVLNVLDNIFNQHLSIFTSFNKNELSKQILTFPLLTILTLMKSKALELDSISFKAFSKDVLKSNIGRRVDNNDVETTNYSLLDKIYVFMFVKHMFGAFRFLYRIQSKIL